jgi:hypothetical protein
MLGNHVRPFRANKPGAILLLAHLTPQSSLLVEDFCGRTV